MTAAVAVEADGTFRTGIPQTLFELREGDYEPSPDGQRFLVVEDVEELEVPPAKVVLNWPALLEQDR